MAAFDVLTEAVSADSAKDSGDDASGGRGSSDGGDNKKGSPYSLSNNNLLMI